MTSLENAIWMKFLHVSTRLFIALQQKKQRYAEQFSFALLQFKNTKLPRVSLLFMKLILDCLADVWDRKLFCVSSDKLLCLFGTKNFAAVVKLSFLFLQQSYDWRTFIKRTDECSWKTAGECFEITQRLIEIDCNLLHFNISRYKQTCFAEKFITSANAVWREASTKRMAMMNNSCY